MKEGIYDIEGNWIEYEGGEWAYDVDSASWIPLEYLEVMGEFIKGFEE